MKIATWNVNSIRTRQDHVKEFLINNEIDILCLQETKVIDADFPQGVFQEIGYETHIFGQKSYNGVAIFSRLPLTNTKKGFSSIITSDLATQLDEQKRLITSTIDNITIVNLYVPNGSAVGSEKYQYKLQWLELLTEYLTTLINQKKQLLVCGDFNIALENIDIYQPKKENHIMASPQERQALKQIIALGFQDIFRQIHPEAQEFSWWDYRQGGFARNRGWRIDHIYLTKRMDKQTEQAYG